MGMLIVFLLLGTLFAAILIDDVLVGMHALRDGSRASGPDERDDADTSALW